MSEKLKSLKGVSIGVIITSIIFGIVLIAFPEQCLKYISLFFGIGMIVIGVVAIINYFVDRQSSLSLVMGVIIGICGIIVCAEYKAILSIVIIIFGIFILAAGITHLATSIRTLVLSRISGWFTLALSIAETIFGIVAITKSGETTEGIIRFIGVALVILAVLATVSLVQFINIAKKVKEDVDATSDIEVEATEE